MPQTTAQKLKIKEGNTLMALHAPDDFKTKLQPLPPGVAITTKATNCQQIHWFVKDKAQMEAELNNILPLVKDKVICWVYYPKGTSKMQTDLTRDKGWDALLQHHQMQWLSLISFDETWSAFGMRLKNGQDKQKAAQPKDRAIFQYIDAGKKIVRLPDDFAALLQQHPKQHSYF